MMMNRSRVIGFSLLLVILFFSAGIKLIKLEADAPQIFPNRFQSSAPVKDEAAKSYEARNKALFGDWSLSEKDDYRYWRTLGPVWAWCVWLWFEAFGVSYVSLRFFSIAWSLMSVLLIYLILKRNHGSSAGLAGALVFAFNFYTMIYGRLGLMETMLNASLILTAFIIIRSLARPGLFVLAPFAFLAACLIKQSALFFAPVLMIGFVMAFSENLSGRKWNSPLLWLGVLSLLVSACVIIYLFTLPEYQLRSIMNLRHALDYPPDPSRHGMILRPGSTLKALNFAFSPSGILRGFLMMMPVAGILAVLEIIAFAYISWKRRVIDRAEVIIILWLILARAVLALTPHQVVRFYLIQFPPACLLAGIFLKRLIEPESERIKERQSYIERLFAYSAVLILALAFNLLPYIRWLSTPSYEIRDGGKRLVAAIGDKPAVIIGEWAGPLCLETPYRSFYVKNIFNRRPEQIAGFGVTHLFYAEAGDDKAAISFRGAFPSAFARRKHVTDIQVFDQTLHLYEVDVPVRGSLK